MSTDDDADVEVRALVRSSPLSRGYSSPWSASDGSDPGAEAMGMRRKDIFANRDKFVV